MQNIFKDHKTKTKMNALIILALLLNAASAHVFDSCGGAKVDAAPHLYLARADADAGISEDELLVISAYAGWLARTMPRLAIVTKAEDLVWLELMSNSTTDVHSLDDVLKALPLPAGMTYVLANLRDNSTSAALSYAAASDHALPATETTEATLRAHGAALAADLRHVNDGEWALDNIDNKKFSQHVSALQSPSSFVQITDMAVKCRALVWFGNGDCKRQPLAKRALGLLAAGDSVVIGWGGGDDPEWGCVHASTIFGTMGVIASDQAYNLAVLSSAKAKTSKKVKQRDTPGTVLPPKKHTVSFLMTDGDNVQWVLNDWSSKVGSNGWWASADRGKVKMGWTLSSSISRLAPSALKIIQSGATENDEIVAVPLALCTPT